MSTGSLSLVLVVGWPALVVLWFWRHRPHAHRARPPRPDRPGRPPRLGPRVAQHLSGLVEGLGRALIRRTGRTPTPERSRRLGTAVVLVAAAIPVSVWLALVLAGAAWALPTLAGRRRQRRRAQEIGASLPETVDLLALSVGAGLTVALAVRQVGRRGSGPVAAELARAAREADLGRRLADALDDIPSPDRGGEACRGLIAVLVASERYGAPLGPGLDRLGTEVRGKRRRQAEEAARKVPVKLLFPLVTCTLPAFALLTVAPLIASALASLRL